MLNIFTAEFILRFMPNGGKAILFRTAFIATYLYLIAIAIRSLTGENATLSFSFVNLRAEVHDTIPWAGTIFGAVYVSLYTRFSSQWSYLAGLYNQQMEVASSTPSSDFDEENFANWQAAFIEDAVCMHLATKRGFSNAVKLMLEDQKIKSILEEDGQLGKSGVKKLENALKKIKNQSPCASPEKK
ncbi:hypothetical protein [Uliginosibacterium sediminicola]|uniref:Uncharacterized protein n=1 Tax=Uliginosibacterium sediminicola TaxID=2024550 RepID=A0ABU9YV22_9RHOO